jgi:hypothetical protein
MKNRMVGNTVEIRTEYLTNTSDLVQSFTATPTTRQLIKPLIIGGDKNKDEMGGTCSTHGETRNTYKILPSREEPLGRHRRRLEDDIKFDYILTGCEGVEWIRLNQDMVQWWALVNTVMNLQVP